MMKGRIISLGLFLFFTASIAFAQNKAHDIDSLVGIYNIEGKFTGSVLAAKDGNIVLKKGYGYRNTAKKQKNDARSIYQIGSVTKMFTSTMILMLQEEGKLNVKDKISKYLPGYPEGDKISIENLLTHTSGIYNYTDDTAFMRVGVLRHHSRADMLALFKDKISGIEPDTKFNYSNSNYVLLGYIIEDITGKPYYKALREMILQPLGMKNTGCDFTRLKSADKATGYFSIDEDNGIEAPIVDSSVSFAAGCIYSTVEDMYKWGKAVIDGKLLRPVDWMMATKSYRDTSKYGYGWMIGELYGKKSIGHNGGVHGFVSNLFLVPEDTTVVILLSNDMNTDLSVIRRGITNILYNKPVEYPEYRPTVKLDIKVLKDYVGEYQLAPQFFIKVYLDGEKLMGQASGQTPFRLFAKRKDNFFLKVIDARIDFARNNNGVVDKILLHQNGQTIPGEKK